MRAAWLLKEEYGIETRVLNVHTVKPLDVAAVVRAAEETGLVVTAEEHQVGGFGNIVAGAILENRQNFQLPLLLDQGGRSGLLWRFRQALGTDAVVRPVRRTHRRARAEAPRQTRQRTAPRGVRIVGARRLARHGQEAGSGFTVFVAPELQNLP